ncbi:MAG: class I tRNA ligase family protein, partial [Vulcanimicrobiaceae bacterium]
ANLANDLGNLAQRSLAMIAANCERKMPEPSHFSETDMAILDAADALLGKARAAIESFALHAVLADIWRVVGDANRYFAAEQPWVKRKTDFARMETIIYVTAEVLRKIAILSQPFIPAAMTKLLDLLGIAREHRGFEHIELKGAPGRPLPTPFAIFPRYIEAEATS